MPGFSSGFFCWFFQAEFGEKLQSWAKAVFVVFSFLRSYRNFSRSSRSCLFGRSGYARGMALKAPPLKAAEIAISSIGLGYDVANDISLKYCKGDSPDPCLLELDKHIVQDIVLPGGLCIPNITRSIKCDKGERMRFRSDVLPFQQMCEQFNQEISLSGKIPSGYFNNVFGFSGSWQKDASATKALAFDGWFITLYTLALSNSQIVLRDHIKQAVPSTWDPAALTRFIERYGTHVIIGLKMGGKDVIYIRQQHSSTLQPIEVQKKLKELADKRFVDGNGHYNTTPKDMRGVEKGHFPPPFATTPSDVIKMLTSFVEFEGREQRLRFAESSPSSSYSGKEDIIKIFKRRGGRDNKELPHIEWLESVQSEPDVISMSFLPITSLLNGVPGSGFLSHAINLYLRYKPPIEELHHFLEFQLPRQWAPVYSDLPLGPQRKQKSSSSSLQFTFLGPKLFVNTSLVDTSKKPVTGIRLYLEGKRSNKLAVHLQHLCSLPQILHLHEDPALSPIQSYDHKWFEPVQWRHFSHVCTAPVEADDDLAIVTGAQLHVGYHGLKKVLFLRLKFASISNASLYKNPEWEGSPNLGQKSGVISTLISTHFSFVAKPSPRPPDVNINSAVYPGGPPVPVQTPKLLKYVDTTEMLRGPQDSPGYWVVSGAKLHLERGKISLRVKYSLLAVTLPDDELQ